LESLSEYACLYTHTQKKGRCGVRKESPNWLSTVCIRHYAWTPLLLSNFNFPATVQCRYDWDHFIDKETMVQCTQVAFPRSHKGSNSNSDLSYFKTMPSVSISIIFEEIFNSTCHEIIETDSMKLQNMKSRKGSSIPSDSTLLGWEDWDLVAIRDLPSVTQLLSGSTKTLPLYS
jgi:hypothetical protein